MTILWLALLPALSALALPNGIRIDTVQRRTEGGLHLPIVRRETPVSEEDRLVRRGSETSAIGLGNYFDVTYQVMVKVGSVETPLILDTGSSDLWVISDQCTGNCTSKGVPTYPQSTFQSEGLSVDLRYGDSRTGTFATGLVGRDTAAVAGLSVDKQVFGAINRTNTSMDAVGAAGIFGLGFPINSVLFSEVFFKEFPQDSTNGKRSVDDTAHINLDNRRIGTIADRFPGLGLTNPDLPKRQSSGDVIADVLSTYATNAPLLARLVQNGLLKEPMVAITLSRNTIDIGGNAGLLSIGELPDGISNSSLTWVPLRLYTPDQGGLRAPQSSPNEVYPIAWEVPIDDVYMNGKVLPRSSLSSSSISVTSLVDTGNSLMRGPEDVVTAALSGIATKSDGTFPCSTPQTMEFMIGGKKFPIDPRDFIAQAFERDTTSCVANLVATDPPSTGFLYSWSMGDPFLKSALVAFYFGNLTHPSVDPPRMGFLSTVPTNANELLAQAIANAGSGNFPATVNSAPTNAATGAAGPTGVNGVPQATTAAGGSSGGSSGGSGSGKTAGAWRSATASSGLLASVGLAVLLGAVIA